jgi:hypothetical protein
MKTFFTFLNTLSKITLLAGVVLFFSMFLLVDRLPGPKEIDRHLFSAPVQSPITRATIEQGYGGKDYRITPRFSYRLYGLVVSARDLSGTWYNVDYFKDPFNVKDLCVIWGKNLSKADYKRVHFGSGLWTCYYKHPKDVTFFPEELSNNHILPADEEVMKALANVRRGDQIFLKGMLVDYESEKAGSRRTSTTRTDAGNNACEIVFATELKILKDANAQFEIVYRAAKYLILGSIALWLFAFLFSPVPKRN